MLKDKKKCTGCAACSAVCPVAAIKMQEDKEGFIYPKIDGSLCVSCGKCREACFNEVGTLGHISAYAAQIQDQDILKQSSSGGIVSALCNKAIADGMAVYAVAYDVLSGGRWIRIDNFEDLNYIRGSKYLQIPLSKAVYQGILDDLKASYGVMMIGTPCQVDGIKRIVPAKLKEKLLLVDLVCGGVISPLIEKQNIHYLEQRHRKPIICRFFRGKKDGIWSNQYYSRYIFDNNSEVSFLGEADLYTRAYNSARLLRYSCYHCEFAKLDRVGDFTVGDCWGVERESFSFPEANKGVSLLMVNSNKAASFLSRVQGIRTEPLKNEFPLKCNVPLHNPSKFHSMRYIAYHLYHVFPFQIATRIVAYRYSIKRILKRMELG